MEEGFFYRIIHHIEYLFSCMRRPASPSSSVVSDITISKIEMIELNNSQKSNLSRKHGTKLSTIPEENSRDDWSSLSGVPTAAVPCPDVPETSDSDDRETMSQEERIRVFCDNKDHAFTRVFADFLQEENTKYEEVHGRPMTYSEMRDRWG